MKKTKFTRELLKNSQGQEREIFRVLFLFKSEHIERLFALVCLKKGNENDKNAKQKATKNAQKVNVHLK